jgi:antitoxin ChpS
MLAVPPAILEVLHLSSGSIVGITIENGRLLIEPQTKPRYRLEELLAQCDESAEFRAEDNDWLNAKPVGAELL